MLSGLKKSELDVLFPAYLETDRDGTITGCGPSIKRHLEDGIAGQPVLDVFEIVRPATLETLEDILCERQAILLECRKLRALKLRGIVISLEDKLMFFMGHATAMISAEGMLAYNYSDFAPYDNTQDLLMATQAPY